MPDCSMKKHCALEGLTQLGYWAGVTHKKPSCVPHVLSSYIAKLSTENSVGLVISSRGVGKAKSSHFLFREIQTHTLKISS